jgi:hypothetical protein
MKRLVTGIALAIGLSLAPQAMAGEGQRLATQAWQQAKSVAVLPQLETLAARAPRDQEARFALGVVKLQRAIEAFGQGLHRHGGTTRAFAFLMPGAPGDMPTAGQRPEPITPAKLRALIAQFVSDLDDARATLAQVNSPSVKLRFEITLLRFDFNADGAPDGPVQDSEGPAIPVAFDVADARWMQGYAQLLAAPADFFLAHDFDAMINASFHLLFPGAGLPMEGIAARDRADANFTGQDTLFADAIAGLHLMRGPVIDPARRAQARTRLLEAVALSRETFRLINAERDNDNEWLSNPRQKSPFADSMPDLVMTPERAMAWMRVLDTAEAMLEGRLLVPHWRFKQGVDMKAFFEQGKEFDLVLTVTGQGLTPFLRDGPVLDDARLNALGRPFGGSFLPFAFWVN